METDENERKKEAWLAALPPEALEAIVRAAVGLESQQVLDMLEDWKGEAQAAQRWVEKTRQNIRELGEDPDSPLFANWYMDDIATLAGIARETRERYGVQLIVKPLVRELKAGRPESDAYNLAFARVYLTQECSTQEAFELYLQEEDIEPLDELDRAARWESFRQAMKYRLKREKPG